MDGLEQDCSNSITNALELLQSFTKPSVWSPYPCSQMIYMYLLFIGSLANIKQAAP